MHPNARTRSRARTAQVMGEHERALDLHRLALTLRQEVGDHAGAAASCYSLALCYESLGQQDLAVEMLRQSRHGPRPPLAAARGSSGGWA